MGAFKYCLSCPKVAKYKEYCCSCYKSKFNDYCVCTFINCDEITRSVRNPYCESHYHHVMIAKKQPIIKSGLNVLTDCQKEWIIKWFPHYDCDNLSVELNLSSKIIVYFAKSISIKKLPKRQRLCSICKIRYQLRKNGIPNRGTHCYICNRDIIVNNLRNSPNLLGVKLKYLYGVIKRRSNIPVDFTEDHLNELFKKQNGLCYYSGVEMVVNKIGNKRNLHSISVDQKIPGAGYTKDNIVLCVWTANVGKHLMLGSEYIKFCEKVVNYNKEVLE